MVAVSSGAVLLGMVLTVFFFGSAQAQRRYDGDQVWRVLPRNQDDITELLTLWDSEQYDDNIDIWKNPTEIGDHFHVHVTASFRGKMAAMLDLHRVPYDVMIHNLQSLVDMEAKNLKSAPNYRANSWSKDGPPSRGRRDTQGSNKSKVSNDIVGTYATWDKIQEWLKDLDRFFVEVVDRIAMTKRTYEGREMVVLKIGEPIPGVQKPAIWVDGGVHAREWVSPASLVYLIYQLLDSYSNDRPDKELMEYLDWYILPVSNPDGYVWSHTSERFWRKNRQYYAGAGLHPDTNKTCYGVDINRNFPFHWGEVGSSTRGCSIVYHGPSGGSELETQAITDFIQSRNDHIKTYFTVHSYGQMVTTRWAYTKLERPDDNDELVRVGKKIWMATQEANGVNFTFGTTPEILYSYAGGSPDWAKGVANIKYSYAFELRDKGHWGFDLPLNQSIPSAQEAYAGIRAMAKELISQYGDELRLAKSLIPTQTSTSARMDTAGYYVAFMAIVQYYLCACFLWGT